MEADGDGDREQLRETVVSAQKADIFQAVDDEHAENCRREKFPNVPDESWRFLILPEDEKRKKTCEHRAEHAQTDRDDLLWNSHISVSSCCLSSLGRSSVSRPRMMSMVGIIKESGPKQMRHSADTERPMIEKTFSSPSPYIFPA